MRRNLLYRTLLPTSIIYLLLYALAGNSNTISQPLDSLQIELDQTKEDTSRIWLMLLMARACALEDQDRAIEFTQRSLDIAEKGDYPKYIGLSKLEMGTILGMNGKADEAVQFLEEAVEQYQQVNDYRLIANAYLSFGSSFYGVDDLVPSTAYNLKALEVAEEYHFPKVKANALNNLGNIYRDQKDFEKAKRFMRESAAMKEELNMKSADQTWLNLGTVYFESGVADSTILYCQKAYDLAIRQERFGMAIQAHMNIALAYTLVPDYEKALEIFEYEERNMEGHFKGMSLGKIYLNMGGLYYFTQQYKKAVLYLDKAITLAEEMNHHTIALMSYRFKSMVYEAQKDYQLALSATQKMVAYKDSIHNSKMEATTKELLTRYETALKENKIRELESEQERKQDKLNIQQAEIKNQNYVMLASGMLLVIMSLIVLILWQRKKKQEEVSRYRLEAMLNELNLLRSEYLIREQKEESNATKNKLEVNDLLLSPLTERELEVLGLIAKGKSNKEISEELFISGNTVKTHISRIYEKLEVKNRTQAAHKAGELFLIDV